MDKCIIGAGMSLLHNCSLPLCKLMSLETPYLDSCRFEDHESDDCGGGCYAGVGCSGKTRDIHIYHPPVGGTYFYLYTYEFQVAILQSQV